MYQSMGIICIINHVDSGCSFGGSVRQMKTSCWIVVGSRGGLKLRKSKGSMTMDEVAVRLQLDIPDELFKRPHLEARIRVDPELIMPNQIDPELIINTADLIEKQTGAKIDFRIIPTEDKENAVP